MASNSQRPGLQAPGATTYAAVAAEAATPSPPLPRRAQPKAHTSESSGALGKLHFMLDLSYCDSQITSRGTAYIKKRLTEGLKLQEETKGFIFCMIVDPKKPYWYLLEFDSDNSALEANIHNAWVLRNKRIQAPESFVVKANNVSVRAVLQSGSMAINLNSQRKISIDNSVGIVCMRWLSIRKPEALQGSLFIKLANKQEAENILWQGYIDIRGEDIYIEAFVLMEEVRKRCFKYQGFGHIMKLCKNELVCSRCSLKGHAQKDCTNP